MPRPPADLRSFVDALRASGRLATVEAEVDTDLEIAEIHRRVIAAGGPALLFTRPKDRDFPVVTNLFGTRDRVTAAFGDEPVELVERAVRLAQGSMPPSLGTLWRERGLLGRLARLGPRRTSKGYVREDAQPRPALDRLPALRTWARDGGPFLTLPLVLTAHPEHGGTNLGMYRGQVFGPDRLGLHAQIGKGGGFHLAEAERLGRPLPVHVHLGGPPATILAAIAPLPENVPELLLASFVLGSRLRTTTLPGRTLPVLADSEFCVVGSVKPGARRPEGPFGDHYGYYSEVHDYPEIEVERVLHRRGAIFPATVVGKPRQEDFFIGDFLQELLAPLMPLVMPGVVDLWSYGETGYHSLAAAIVRERYRKESMSTAFRVLGEGQLALTKFLLLTDGDVDLHDFRATLVHVLERAELPGDLHLFGNLSMDSLDYAGPRINEGSKGVLVGLGEKRRSLPERYEGAPPPEVRAVRAFCPGALCVEVDAHERAPDLAQELARHAAFRDWPLLVLTDDADRASRSAANFLWTTFTRFDPARDVVPARVEVVGTQTAYHAPLAIDARMKRWYPEELFCDDATAEKVTKRWGEYFPAGSVEMGDSGRGHLD
ncbi:MAG: UbiD family decarboxylase [Planctomycetota bacterium]